MSILTAYDKFIQQALKYGFSLWGTSKTGQTTKYRTGDDGDFEKGYPKLPPRFTDNGDGTITDNATGLMWVADPSLLGGKFGTPGTPTTMNWIEAIDECVSLNYAGHSDWRLPNVKELMSIVDYGDITFPVIDETFFVCVGASYMTSTTVIAYTLYIWQVGFYAGIIDAVLKTYYRLVRPVRLGVPK